MKRLIAQFIVGCVIALGLTSCSDVDKTHYANYKYINWTSSTITIECYYGGAWEAEEADPDELYKTITISSGESETVSLSEVSFCLPFRWRNGHPYLLVKNNAVAVFERYSTDKLLYMESYTLTSSSETVRNYQYVFTEEYFKDGKPVE